MPLVKKLWAESLDTRFLGHSVDIMARHQLSTLFTYWKYWEIELITTFKNK